MLIAVACESCYSARVSPEITAGACSDCRLTLLKDGGRCEATPRGIIVTLGPGPLCLPHAANSHLVTKRNVSRRSRLIACLLLTTASLATAQKAATATSLKVTSGTTAITSASAGTVVTLTAAVTAQSAAVKVGQVNFCDASAAHCTDVHLLGTAQLNQSGIAVFKYRPGIGAHSYKAVFVGTTAYAASSSPTSSLSVTGKFATVTSIAQQGYAGQYTLTATVAGAVNSAKIGPPTGSVSFVDTTSGNTVLAQVPVGSATQSFSYSGAGVDSSIQNPNHALAADFNGDGIADVALTNFMYGSASIAILLGNGHGGFTAGPAIPSGVSYPVALVAADFNSDGILDLASVSNQDNRLTILLGQPDGSFTAEPGIVLGTGPQAMTTADFNNDGVPDLVVTTNNSALVYLGVGDGTFTQANQAPAFSFSAGAVAAADFNGDGIADLAVANWLQAGGVTILFGKGDGTFDAGTAAQTPGSVSGIAPGDLNGDGILDLAVTSYDGGDHDIAILLGNGDGTFRAGTHYRASGINCASIVLTDANGDGVADLAVGSSWNLTSLLIGNGDGTFQSSTPVFDQNHNVLSSGQITVADFDGDGVPDFAIPDENANKLAVLLTLSAETVTATLDNPTLTGPGPHNVLARYPGDSKFLASDSTTTSLDVQAAVPLASLKEGTYASVQTVTLTDATPGATIHYQVFSLTASAGFKTYTGPITVSDPGATTIQYYASETGYLDSNWGQSTYTLNLPQTATPVLSLAAGYYANTQTVTIADGTANAKIHYTTDGSYPTVQSSVYTGPITVASSEVVSAAALAVGYSYSKTASAQYIIGSAKTSMVYTVAGNETTGFSGDGGPATVASLNGVDSAVRDSKGNLYIADSRNQVIRKVAVGTGIISTYAGTGVAGYSGDGGPASAAQVNYPGRLAIDGSDNLYFADIANGVVREITATGGDILTVAGGSASGGTLLSIAGLAVDAAGNIYVSDGWAEVRKIAAGTGVISAYAGTGIGTGYSGDNGPATSAHLANPQGLATDTAGNLYIADTSNQVIRRVDSSGIIATVAGTGYGAGTYIGGFSGDGGPASGARLNIPEGVAVDSSGNLFIIDAGNERIREVTAKDGVINTVLGNGNCTGYQGDGGPARSAGFCDGIHLSVDAAGNLLFVDGGRVREAMVAAAPPSTKAPSPQFSLSSGTFADPQVLAISSKTPGAAIYVTIDGSEPTTSSPMYNGPITVAGTLNIKAIAVAPGYLAGDSASASYTVTSWSPVINTLANGSGDNGFLSKLPPPPPYSYQSRLANLSGIVIDGAGNAYFSDSYNAVVWKLSTKTGAVSIFAGTGTSGYSGDGGLATAAQLATPHGLAIDKAGDIYIADTGNRIIRKVAAATGKISTFAGVQGSSGWPTSGDGGPATSATFLSPQSLAFDTAGNLYISDSSDGVVREVSARDGTISTVAGTHTTSPRPPLGDGGAATSAYLGQPADLALDSRNNLYISCPSLGRVRRVDPTTGFITTVVGNGNAYGSTGDGAPALSAEIAPNGLAIDSADNLYISNQLYTIRKFDPTTGKITRAAGIGLFGTSSGDGNAALVAQLNYPAGMTFDSAGDMLFVESWGGMVREILFTANPVATPVFSPAGGSYTSAQSVTITDSLSTASIYYTVDGSTPTTSSTLYTGAIPVTASVTIKAVAVATGYTPSAVATATYTVVSNPAPTVNEASPAHANAGTSAFSMTVNGSGFAAISKVYWGSTELSTQFLSSTQLTASVTQTLISSAGTANITVQTPAPGGGTSNTFVFEIDSAGATNPTFGNNSTTVSAGGTATYAVTLSSSATNVSVLCLNLPKDATCNYDPATQKLSIATASTTPSGTWKVTAVFTETLPGAATAFILFPVLLLPLYAVRRKLSRGALLSCIALALTVTAGVAGCGGGSSSGSSNPPPPQTHQVRTSGTVTLIVQ